MGRGALDFLLYMCIIPLCLFFENLKGARCKVGCAHRTYAVVVGTAHATFAVPFLPWEEAVRSMDSERGND